MSAFQNTPDPSFEVIQEDEKENKWKAELTIYVARKGRMECKDVRVRGPKRNTRREAQLDGHELKKSCLVGGFNAEAAARKKQADLLRREWDKEDLDEFEEVAERLDELFEERKRMQKLARITEKHNRTYQPIGPNWSSCGPMMPRPDWGGPWSVYQKRDLSTGKFLPHLYFDTSKNEYFYDQSKGYASAAPPTLPSSVPLSVSSAYKTVANDLSIVVGDLQRTAVVAKQPLDFLDMPAMSMSIFDNLDPNAAHDISYLAKNYFTRHLIPKLSQRHTEWEDFELRDILMESLEDVDKRWMDTPNGFSGAGASVVLVVGNRLTAATLADGAVVFINLSDDASPAKVLTKSNTQLRTESEEKERISKVGATLNENGVTTLDRGDTKGPAERINLARNSFEALGITPSEFPSITKLYRRLSLQVHPDKCQDPGATEAFGNIEKAKEAMLSGFEKQPKELGELFEMFRLYYESPVLTMKVLKEIESKARRHDKIVNLCKEDVMKAQKILIEAQELIKHGLVEDPRTKNAPYTNAMGFRSLKRPFPIVTATPDASMPEDLAPGKYGIALLSSAGKLGVHDPQSVAAIEETIRKYIDKPKACALAINKSRKCSAVVSFITVEKANENCKETENPAKRPKTAPAERVFLRHILVKHSACVFDMNDRDQRSTAPWRTRTLQEAEEMIVDVLETLTSNTDAFPQKCREVSDCKTAENPMSMCGHLGWVTKGQIDTMAFELPLNGVSDVIQSDRGLQILHRVG